MDDEISIATVDKLDGDTVIVELTDDTVVQITLDEVAELRLRRFAESAESKDGGEWS